MSSSFAPSGLFVVRVATPDGDLVELDCPPCADYRGAARLATRLAGHLARPAGGPLGTPSKVAAVLAVLRAFWTDPLDCEVQVVVPSAPSPLNPNGWRVVRTRQVAAYATADGT